MRFPGPPPRVETMEVRMFSICIFSSSLSDTYLHTSMITYLWFAFIPWASVFSRVSRDREALSRLILDEGKVESTSSGRGGLGGVMKGI